MKKWIVMVLICFQGVSIAIPQDAQAESYYKDQEYKKALTSYQLLLEKHPDNSDIMYNLANTHYKLDNIGYAVGYYLKALRLNSLNKDARYNLNLIQDYLTKEKDKKSQKSLLKWMQYISINTSFYMFISLLCLTLLCARGWQTASKYKSLYVNGTVIALCFCLVSVGVFGVKWSEYKTQKATIIVKKIDVHSGPSNSLPTLFYAHDGMTCTVKTVSGQWVEISFENGFEGWVKLDNLFLI